MCSNLAVLHPLDDGDGPQRPGDVQRGLQHHLGEVEHLTKRARRRDPHPADVKVQVEVGIHHPSWRRGRNRRSNDLLSKPKHATGRILEDTLEAVPVRRGVQDFHGHDPRPCPGVGLAAMQKYVQRIEFFWQPGRVERINHR
jgi:hypothetical protein